MNRKLWYLTQLDLFKSLTEKEITYIGERFGEKEYKKRQVVLEPQDRNKVFILKSGRMEIYELTQDGKKIIVDVLSHGNVFGDLGVNESVEHFVEATTNSFVCVMGKDEFFEMVSKTPKLSNILLKELFSKTIESEKQVAALASNSLLVKVKNLLLRLAKRHGEIKDGKVRITTKFTHEQLAEMIGISRPTMTETLNKMEKDGVIERDGKIISFDARKFASL